MIIIPTGKAGQRGGAARALLLFRRYNNEQGLVFEANTTSCLLLSVWPNTPRQITNRHHYSYGQGRPEGGGPRVLLLFRRYNNKQRLVFETNNTSCTSSVWHNSPRQISNGDQYPYGGGHHEYYYFAEIIMSNG